MSPPSVESNDTLLHSFLNAPTSEEDDAALTALLELARPIIVNLLRRKALLLNSQSDLGEELYSAAAMRIIEQLRKCKYSFEAGDETAIIRHFPALCQTIASTVVNEHVRLKYPRRTSLQNQLLYLFREAKDASNLPLFALWRDIEEQLCGWRFWDGRSFVATERHRLLSEDTVQAMHQALPGENAGHLPLQKVVESLFHWLKVPAIFDEVVSTTARWRGIEDQSALSLSSSSSDESPAIIEPPAPDLSPEEKLIFGEYLRSLWKSIKLLPPNQRAALLLNLCDAQGRGVLGFLPALGIVGFHEIAATLELEPREFVDLWPRLPLEDREIAKMYGTSAPVVCVWRSRARARLKKEVEEL